MKEDKELFWVLPARPNSRMPHGSDATDTPSARRIQEYRMVLSKLRALAGEHARLVDEIGPERADALAREIAKERQS